MKTLVLAVGLSFAFFSLALGAGEFPGLEKSMDSDTYERAGLRKLSAEERAVLDDYIRDYVSGKQKAAAEVAATQAVDRAVKEHKVEPPTVIESRIVGTYKGYGFRTLFRLENGQVWKPTNGETVPSQPIETPRVIIFKDGLFGFKMFIEGGSTIHVKQLQ
jgi:hypothetical protein